MAQTPRPRLTVAEAAAALGVSVKTVRRWADQGHLPHERTPTGYRTFDPAIIAAYQQRMRAVTISITQANAESLLRAIATHLDRGYLEGSDADLYHVRDMIIDAMRQKGMA